MPVPTVITDLSTTAASNYPAGTDSPSTLDDVQRAHASFIAQLRDGSGFTAGALNALVTAPTALASINGGQLAGLRNRIINGGMVIAQRPTATLTGTAQYGQTDRMQVWCSSGTSISGSIAQGTSSGFSSGYYAGASAASWTTGQFIFQQKIEALNVQDLNSKTVTVSCKVYQDTGGTRNFVIGLLKPGALNDWTTNSLIGGAYSSAKAATTATVTTISASFNVGATDAINGLMVQIVDNATNTVVSKNYFVSDLQLELGSVATTFEQRPIGLELALCQRYYGKSYAQGTVAGTATAVGSCYIQRTNSTASDSFGVRFPITMRTTPTSVAVYSTNTGASGNIYDGSGIADVAATANNVGDAGFAVGWSATTSRFYMFQYTATAEL